MEVNVSMLNDQFFCAGFIDIWRFEPKGDQGSITAFVRYDPDNLGEVYRIDVKRYPEWLPPDIDLDSGLQNHPLGVVHTPFGWYNTVYRAKKVLPVS
ncbi:hypothetical protein [Nocardia sp. NPDC059228]|uniref:hypothetical protein n=1 Tax=Nocardia sp. NPDC059228 TaxID=3346777 RepID=UPI0036759675